VKQLVVYSTLPEPLLAALRERFDVSYFEYIDDHNRAAFTAAVRAAHGLLGTSVVIDRALLEPARVLEAVSTISVGYDNFDVNYLTQRGIVLAHTPDVLTESTADTIFALILASARRVVELAGFVKAGEWNRSPAPEAEAQFGARRLPLDELLAQSDFVCVVLPLTAATEKLIGARELALMKPGAIFVNGARGRIVDERALIEALRNGTIHGAGLDVFEDEPLPPDSPLPAMKNVVALPHIGSATHETRYAMARLAVDNIIAALEGRPQNVVNPVVATARLQQPSRRHQT
jgi:phosphogluconate 2-dehydrogenase/gluconate 2-dehydrogenase